MTPGRRVPFATRLRLVGVSTMLFVWAIPAAVAQTVDAAHGPLFGADTPSGARRLLDLTVSMTEGRDDDLGGDSGTGGSPLQPHLGGSYQDLDSVLSFAESNRRFGLAARATGTARRTPGFDRLVGSNGSAAADLSVTLDRRTSLRTSLVASHVSNFAFDTFAQRAAVASPEEATSSSISGTDAALDWARTSYGGSVALTRAVGKVSRFSLVAGVGHSERPTLRQRSGEQAVTALFGRSVGREGILRASYTYSQGLQTIPNERNSIWSQDVQLSVERTWRHSKFRRTVVSLSAGPSLLQQKTIAPVTVVPVIVIEGDLPQEPFTAQREETERLFRVVGTAALGHDITRTWSTQAWYRRGTGVRDAVFFANAGGLDLRGRFGRRISVTVSAGYTDGDLNIGTLLNRYGTSYGSTRLQAALGRWAAVQGQYFFYHYEYKAGPELPNGQLPHMNRRGLRVGLVLWAPLKRG